MCGRSRGPIEGKARPGMDLDKNDSAAQILAAFLGVSVEELPPLPEELD